MLERVKRGQVSLEFMMVFAIMLILLLYSVQNVTFSKGTPSTENLRIQVSLEEKNLANAISTTISQVYAQGPGAKSTAYVKLTFLRDPKMLSKALDVDDPVIVVTYGYNPDNLIDPQKKGNGTYVTVLPRTGEYNTSFYGGDKKVFWSASLYQKTLCNVSETVNGVSTWYPLDRRSIVGTNPCRPGFSEIYGLRMDPTELPPVLEIVVTWDPTKIDSWEFNSTEGVLYININPGG